MTYPVIELGSCRAGDQIQLAWLQTWESLSHRTPFIEHRAGFMSHPRPAKDLELGLNVLLSMS